MLCKNCGKRVYKSNVFCSRCGEKIEAPCEVAAGNGEVTIKSGTKFSFGKIISTIKLNKKTRITVISVCCAIIIGVFGLLTWLFFASRVDLTDYIEIYDVKGFSGYASLEYEVDFVRLSRDLDLDNMGDIKELEGLQEYGIFFWGMKLSDLKSLEKQYDLDLDDFIDLYRDIEIKIDNNGRLKNGDKGKIEIIVSKYADFDKRLVGGTVDFKVEGLGKAIVLDLFEDTEIIFSGKNGNGSIAFNKNDSDSWSSWVNFTCNKKTGLKNGDTVTVTATFNQDKYEYYSEELMHDGKHLPKTATKKFTVSGLTVYAKLNNITEKVINDAFELIKQKHFSYGYDDVSCSKAFFAERTDNFTSSYYAEENALLIKITTVNHYSNSGNLTYNTIYRVSDIRLDENGKVVLGNLSGSLYSLSDAQPDSSIADTLKDYFDGFTIVELR